MKRKPSSKKTSYRRCYPWYWDNDYYPWYWDEYDNDYDWDYDNDYDWDLWEEAAQRKVTSAAKRAFEEGYRRGLRAQAVTPMPTPPTPPVKEE